MSQPPTPRSDETPVQACPATHRGATADRRDSHRADHDGADHDRADHDRADHDRADHDRADHDLADRDERLFRAPSRPWPHPTTIGTVSVLVGLLLTGAAAVHLGDMGERTVGAGVSIPDGTPVSLPLRAGDQRMIYTERTPGLTSCAITDDGEGRVGTETTVPVILQGSDALWHGRSLFKAHRDGTYTVRCDSGHSGRQVRVGLPVGTWDVVLTLLATGVGGICLLGGAALAVWGWLRRRHAARPASPSPATAQSTGGFAADVTGPSERAPGAEPA